MMLVLLGISTGGLALVVVILAIKLAQRSQQMNYIHLKLEHLLDQGTYERLLVFSNDAPIQQLLRDINQVLDYAHRAGARYANQEKEMRNMLSNISHDLKTPLTVVLGYSETLLHSPALTDQEREAMIGKIHDKAQEVLRLIHSFFDLAKLESGDMELSMTRVNLSELCRLKMISFYEMLTGLGLEVKLDIPEGDLFVQANEEAIDRVLNNLITNAMKYGSDGKMLGLSLHHTNSDGVLLEIWDQGKGIPESEHSRVFERMYTLEDSRNRQYQGSGLGLTITKRLVERMGGSIELRSVPNQRTVFYISLKPC